MLGGGLQPMELLLQLLRTLVGFSSGFGETLCGGQSHRPAPAIPSLAGESTLKFSHLMPVLDKLAISNINRCLELASCLLRLLQHLS